MSAFNPWRGLRGLPSDVWIIVVTSFVNRVGVMALPFLVLYLTQYLHVSATLAALAITTYGIGGLVTAPIAGRLSDRLGAFAVMRASLVLTGIILLLVPLAHDIRLILAMTFCWAGFADAVRPATLSGLTALVAPEQRKPAIALNRLAVNLGMSIGPAVGGFLAAASFPLLFVVDGLTSLAAAIVLSLLLWLRKPVLAAPRTIAPRASSSASVGGATVWRDRTALTFLAAVFLVSLVFMQNDGALPLYIVRDLHHNESFFGLLFVLNTIIIVVIEVPLNVAMAHWPHHRSLMLGTVCTAAGFGMVAVARTPVALAATVVIWTFGEMIFFPSSTSYVADIAPPGRNGEYMGAYTSMFSLALVFGPWAGTAALDRFGPAAMWAGVFVCGLLAIPAIAVARPSTKVVEAEI